MLVKILMYYGSEFASKVMDVWSYRYGAQR
jgi:hypothetical protein